MHRRPHLKVVEAFEKIQRVNGSYNQIEITSNFVMDDTLPDSHYESLLSLLRESVNRINPKGCIYFSPLQFQSPSRQVLYDFYKLKSLSRFPTYLYLIQRL